MEVVSDSENNMDGTVITSGEKIGPEIRFEDPALDKVCKKSILAQQNRSNST